MLSARSMCAFQFCAHLRNSRNGRWTNQHEAVESTVYTPHTICNIKVSAQSAQSAQMLKTFRVRRWTHFTRSMQCTSDGYNSTMHVVVPCVQSHISYPHTHTHSAHDIHTGARAQSMSIGECDRTPCYPIEIIMKQKIQNSIVVASIHHFFV